MGAPSQQELIALEKFREAIQNTDMELNEKQQHDMALITWLRARDMNIPQATEMLKKSYTWRKTENIDDVLNWNPPESFIDKYYYELCGKSLDDNPVIVVPFGKWDVRSSVEVGEKNTWLRYVDKMFAIVYKDMDNINDVRENGLTPITQCIIIVDFEGFGIRQLTSVFSVQTLIECVKRFEDNYPEILKAFYFINAPWAFSILFSIIKPLMSARTLNKLEVYTSNPIKWQPALLKYISPDQLPVVLGGTNTNSCKFSI